MTGNLIIVSAPSGAGKTTLVSELIERDGKVKPSISYTSRPQRPGEENGVHYFFVTPEEFDIMIERGEFLEWARVHGNLYGTSRSQVERLRASGSDAVLTIDVQGAELARKQYPEAIGIFVLPPSYRTLVERLGERRTDSSEDLKLRMRNALNELAQYKSFDYLLINKDLAVAAEELSAIIKAERCRCERRAETAEQIIQTFKI